MKINIIILIFFIITLCFSSNAYSSNNILENKISIQSSLAEQIYSKLVVSSRILEYTNSYIDSKSQSQLGVPNNVWLIVKNGIDYSYFRNTAIKIIEDNLTRAEMQKLLNDYEKDSFIPIPGTIIKKQLYELSKTFEPIVEQKIQDILRANGY